MIIKYMKEIEIDIDSIVDRAYLADIVDDTFSDELGYEDWQEVKDNMEEQDYRHLIHNVILAAADDYYERYIMPYVIGKK